MKIEAAELEGHLSAYLQQIRSTGETITVCKGNEPIATLSPLLPGMKRNGPNLIDRLLAAPIPVQNFTPLTRAEIYERK